MSGMEYKLDHNSVVYREYVSDFNKWEKDGERFLSDEFIDKYLEGKTIPMLYDGRPEFNIWISYTNASGVFYGGWNSGTRYHLAKPFILNMLNIYENKKMLDECLMWLRYSLIALDEIEDI